MRGSVFTVWLLIGSVGCYQQQEPLPEEAEAEGLAPEDATPEVASPGAQSTPSRASGAQNTPSREREQAAQDTSPREAAPEPSDEPEPASVPGGLRLSLVNQVLAPPARADDELVMLWRIYEPSQPYEPQRVTTDGDVLSKFGVILDGPPSEDARFALEDPVTGVQLDPDAVRVAGGGLYRVAAGALDASPEGVIALDVDKVIGQADGLSVLWTPVDLPSTEGVRGFDPGAPLGPLAAGYHLFVNGREVDAGTLLTMDSEIHD
jgi:hypothetical protein